MYSQSPTIKKVIQVLFILYSISDLFFIVKTQRALPRVDGNEGKNSAGSPKRDFEWEIDLRVAVYRVVVVQPDERKSKNVPKVTDEHGRAEEKRWEAVALAHSYQQ